MATFKPPVIGGAGARFTSPPPIYRGGNVDTTSEAANTALINPRQTGSRDAGSGRGDLSPAEKSKIFNMAPRARQAYLRSMGYNVKVDGKSGPQTASAAWSFVHGHSASFFNNQTRDWQNSIWNQHFAKYHKPAPGDPAGAAPKAGTGKVPGNDNNQTPADPSAAQFSVSPSAVALGKDLSAGVTQLYTLSRGGTLVDSHLADNLGTMLDPNAAGAAAAEAQYGAALRAQAAEVKRLPTQALQDQADLQSWYSKIAGTQAKSAAADAAMADSLIGDSTGASAGVINALGGAANPSAGDLGAAGENETAALRALKLAGAIGSSEIGSAIGAEGLSARTRQRNLDRQSLVDAENKLYDTQQQSGAASTQEKDAAIGANNALAQARLQARLGIIGQNNSLISDRAQRVAAALSAEEGAASLGPDLAYKGALATAAEAKAANPAGTKTATQRAAKGAWVNLNGPARRALTSDATGIVQAGTKAGDSVTNIVSRVVNSYRAQGLHPANNPQVAQAIVGVLEANGIKVSPTWAIAKWAKFKTG